MSGLSEENTRPISILLVEDHIIVRESLRHSLECNSNFNVVGEASDGEEAITMAQELKPDVIIMDISLPKLNGIEATRQIKAIQPAVAILVLTAHNFDQYIFPLLAAGAAGYLLKDVSSQELVTAIEKIHQGESVIHPAIAHKVLERDARIGDKTSEESRILSEQEIIVLKMAAKGLNNKVIANELGLSVRTVESHLASAFGKLGAGSRTQAVVQAMKEGWFTLEELT